MFARSGLARTALNGARTVVRQASTSTSTSSSSTSSSSSSWVGDAAALLGTAAAALGFHFATSSDGTVLASDALHPPQYPWTHTGWFQTYDKAAIRRGHQVFQEVCSTCHSLDRLAYRNLVGVAYTEDEAKAIAAQVEIEDGPDDNGNMFMRPGKLSDYFAAPYKNEVQARLANNGALPPDLSLIIKARHDGANYLFALLTGYCDPPAGVELPDSMHFVPYFPGGKIGMAKALMDDLVEYEDGTPATTSQMAYDVTVFLSWAAEPEADERKRMGLKALVYLGLLGVGTYILKRRVWAVVKSQQVIKNSI